MQGAPHNHSIAGVTVALLETQTPEFKDYAQQALLNSKALARGLMNRGHTLVTGGTDNHIVLWNMRPHGLTGSKFEELSNYTNMTLNKNTIPGDTSAANPHGIRLGSWAVTTRGYREKDMDIVAEFLDRICKEAIHIQKLKGKKLSDFVEGVKESNEAKKISKEIEEFAVQFKYPGLSI